MAKTLSDPKTRKIKKSDMEIQGCDFNNCRARKTYFSRCYLAPQEDRPCIITVKNRG